MTPNDILLYSLISALFGYQQKTLPPAADGNKYRDPQPDITKKKKKKKKKGNLEHSSLNEMSLLNPFPQGSATTWKRRQSIRARVKIHGSSSKLTEMR